MRIAKSWIVVERSNIGSLLAIRMNKEPYPIPPGLSIGGSAPAQKIREVKGFSGGRSSRRPRRAAKPAPEYIRSHQTVPDEEEKQPGLHAGDAHACLAMHRGHDVG